tara:strand:- start:23 stop:700 length:678 start_codon:yes stop_codon:yes gene_type:complete
MINKFGGFIKEYKRVSFYRKNLESISKGISNDLKNKINKFETVILACPVQIGVKDFFWYDKKDLDLFLDSLISLAKNFKETLIIIKGKKNELNYAEQKTIQCLNKFDNIYIIESDKPKLLNYNQFEDLIGVSSIMLSINSGSTTIWQSYANFKPVIIFNEDRDRCWLSEYQHTEVGSKDLSEAVSFWLNIDGISKDKFIGKILKDANMGSLNGLKEIAEDIQISL